MDKLYFGTAGVPLSSRDSSSAGGIERVKELNLGCMELEFVNGVKMGEKTARLVASKAADFTVKLSVHGPYWINLNSKEPEKIVASRERILQAARIGELCSAQSVVFHAAFYHDDEPAVVLERVVENLTLIRQEMQEQELSIILRPELTGKGSQFGSLTEVIEVSRRVAGVLPCIDFGHLHAREGAYNTYPEFCSALSLMEAGLGRAALDNVHFHVSGINYGAKGERNHLVMAESDFNYQALLQAFKDFDLKGLVICESPNIETDALLLQEFYDSL
ncbi:MAG: TIM barrel protein [Peptococcaceae bacterium]|nr:TIM barrel protein [Peptococcaceae bacterium]